MHRSNTWDIYSWLPASTAKCNCLYSFCVMLYISPCVSRHTDIYANINKLHSLERANEFRYITSGDVLRKYYIPNAATHVLVVDCTYFSVLMLCIYQQVVHWIDVIWVKFKVCDAHLFFSIQAGYWAPISVSGCCKTSLERSCRIKASASPPIPAAPPSPPLSNSSCNLQKTHN